MFVWLEVCKNPTSTREAKKKARARASLGLHQLLHSARWPTTWFAYTPSPLGHRASRCKLQFCCEIIIKYIICSRSLFPGVRLLRGMTLHLLSTFATLSTTSSLFSTTTAIFSRHPITLLQYTPCFPIASVYILHTLVYSSPPPPSSLVRSSPLPL